MAWGEHQNGERHEPDRQDVAENGAWTGSARTACRHGRASLMSVS
jgi:hypothetical protein